MCIIIHSTDQPYDAGAVITSMCYLLYIFNRTGKTGLAKHMRKSLGLEIISVWL